MKPITLFIITLLALGMAFISMAQERPLMRHHRYFSEVWRGRDSDAHYPMQANPDTGLFGWVDVGPNEPVGCYPMHSGIVEGVSDTITVIVQLRNYNQTDYDISSYNLSNWFEPVIYDINADPFNAIPLSQPSSFGYSFQYVRDWFRNIVTQPSVIPLSDNLNMRYSLVYHVWGLPAGRFRLLMKTTSYAPSSFQLRLRQVHSVWITKPVDLADTLTAYAACFWRSYKRGSITTALTWANSILAKNPTSVSGYILRNVAYSGLNDSLAAITGLDSTIAILERQGDPLLPDTSNMNKWEKMWYDDRLMIARYCRWQMITGKSETLQ